jgi:hypothetical protein
MSVWPRSALPVRCFAHGISLKIAQGVGIYVQGGSHGQAKVAGQRLQTSSCTG